MSPGDITAVQLGENLFLMSPSLSFLICKQEKKNASIYLPFLGESKMKSYNGCERRQGTLNNYNYKILLLLLFLTHFTIMNFLLLFIIIFAEKLNVLLRSIFVSLLSSLFVINHCTMSLQTCALGFVSCTHLAKVVLHSRSYQSDPKMTMNKTQHDGSHRYCIIMTHSRHHL